MSTRSFIGGLAATALAMVALVGLGLALSRVPTSWVDWLLAPNPGLFFGWSPSAWIAIAILASLCGVAASSMCQERES